MPYSRLRYHLVWTTKHRRRLITLEVEGVAYAAMRREAERIGIWVFEIGGVADHVHLVVAIPPHLSVSYVIARLKSVSSAAVRRRWPGLGFRWQRGFAALTLRANDFNDVCVYVRQQKQRHADDFVLEELERVDDE